MRTISKQPNDSDPQSQDRLEAIAAGLDIATNEFTEESSRRSELDDTCALLQIWRNLGCSADRRKLITFARTLASQKPEGC